MSGLGLHRHRVKLAPHDPQWIAMGEENIAALKAACARYPVHVEHVGSTSVAGLPAKPILDLVLGLEDLCQFDDLRKTLCDDMRYIYRGFQAGGIGHLFVQEAIPDVRTIHTHVVPFPSTDWNEYVCFRDLLRDNSTVQHEYQSLKQSNAERFMRDRNAYTQAKHEFVQHALRTLTDCYDPY